MKELREKFSDIKLIASDIDGTLLDSNGKIGDKTVQMINCLIEKGILFTFATQRVHSSIIPFAEILNVKTPLITMNGALIQDINGNCISKSVIPRRKVEKALELAEKHYVKIAFCYNDIIVYTEENSVLKDFMVRFGTTYEQVNSYDDYKDEVLEIIMLGNDRNIIKDIQKKMNFPFRTQCTAKYYKSRSHNGVYHLEVLRSGVNKKTGLGILAKNLKLKKNQVAVMGDWYNDRHLFDFGGVNIALENAVPELKHKANYITEYSNEDDGVGKFLELTYNP